MSAEGHYYREYDPDFRVAVDEDSVASINAGYRYRHSPLVQLSFPIANC